jgi:hypothetical protein
MYSPLLQCRRRSSPSIRVFSVQRDYPHR